MAGLDAKIKNLILNREKTLDRRPVHSIARALGQLSKRWLDKNYLFRKKAIRRLVKQSKFSQAMAHALLDSLFRELTETKLLKLLEAELKDPRALDEFRYDKLTGKWQRARGPRVIVHIFSGNVPNPSLVSFIFGMLMKSVNIGKVSSKDEGFLDIYLESLKAFDKALASTNFLLSPKNKKSTRHALQKSDLVISYGNDESLKEVKNQAPATTAFVGYGHRISFGIYAKEVLNKKNQETFAKKTARDIWMMDQRGCLSPMEIFVEAGGKVSPLEFSEILTKAMERLFALKAWRIPASLGAATVIGFGGRKMISVRLIKNLENILKILKPFQKHLQAVSLETGDARRKKIADRLSEMGVNRICRAGQMQRPPITWHHDGKFNLASWVHWTDLET